MRLLNGGTVRGFEGIIADAASPAPARAVFSSIFGDAASRTSGLRS